MWPPSGSVVPGRTHVRLTRAVNRWTGSRRVDVESAARQGSRDELLLLAGRCRALGLRSVVEVARHLVLAKWIGARLIPPAGQESQSHPVLTVRSAAREQERVVDPEAIRARTDPEGWTRHRVIGGVQFMAIPAPEREHLFVSVLDPGAHVVVVGAGEVGVDRNADSRAGVRDRHSGADVGRE